MGTIAITGSASGIGAATRTRLEADGHRVIGIDLADAEVVADLGVPGGRAAMVRHVTDLSDGVLDGLVVAAGMRGDDGSRIVSVNYFGAVATLAGLRPLLERGESPSAVAIGSNSATTQPGLPGAVIEACLAADEAAARTAAAPDGSGAYGASKTALARWIRHFAPGPGWMAAGIRLNAIAPGFIDTPLTAGTWDFVASLGEVYPMPQGRPGTAVEVAGLVAYLLSVEAAYFCGSVLVMDGGTEARLRTHDWPRPIGH